MVVGKTSSFIEGFENITVDKDLLLQNLSSTLDLLAANKNVPPMPTMMGSAMPNIPPMPNMMGSAIPNIPQMPPMMPSMNKNIQPINLNNPVITQAQISNPTMSMITNTQPQVTMPMNTLSSDNPLRSLNQPSFLNEQNMITTSTMPQISQQKSTFKNTKSSFKDIKNKMEKESNKDEDSENELDEESDDDDDEVEESFQNYNVESFVGSKVIESNHLRNMILSFILSFISLMTIFSIYKLFRKNIKQTKLLLLSWLVCFGIVFIFLEVSTYL